MMMNSTNNFSHKKEEHTSNTRFKEILSILRKHSVPRNMTPFKLREILEDLGPTYIKLGQIMSLRSDILPKTYCQELTLLQTQVKPLSFEMIRQVIESELNASVSSVFSYLDPKPIGAASIAQVHSAIMPDGQKVVVKVQRPAIRETISNDIALLRKACKLVNLALDLENLIDLEMILDELWNISLEETDFTKEASNLDLFYQNQKDLVYISSPIVLHKQTTSKVLTMSYIDGIPIDHIDELISLGYDRNEIGLKMAENYCKQVLSDGFFHADPHPGNLWISGGQIVWLDLGMTGHLSDYMKQLLKKAIHSILSNDIYTLKDVLLCLGEPKAHINHARLYEDLDTLVNKYIHMDIGKMNLGQIVQELLDLLKNHQIAIKPEITLLGRSLITIEGTLSLCAPELTMIHILSDYMSALLFQEINIKSFALQNSRLLYSSLQKSMEIPALLSDLLHITKNGQLKQYIEFSDSQKFFSEFHRSYDNLALSLLCAALFIGSSFLCMTDVVPKIFHLPWISFFGFCLSGLLVLWIIIRILKKR